MFISSLLDFIDTPPGGPDDASLRDVLLAYSDDD